MIDRLRQMAIFAKAMDHGSFRGAAAELHLSPSVVSHHISQLEEHLGVALIYRSTRKLSLTSEGQRLLVATQNMLDAVEGELLDLSASANEPSGEIRITAPSVLSQSRFADMIAEFSIKYPRIQLTLDFSDARRELIGDGFDLAIRMKPNAKNSATSRRLYRVQRRLVASTGYVSNRPKVDDPEDIADWDWLVLTPVRNLPVTFRKEGKTSQTVKPKARILTNDAQAMYKLATADAGLALVPDFLAQRDVADGRMAFVLPDWQLDPIDVFAVWPANAPKHGLIHLLLSELGHDGKNNTTSLGVL